MILLDFLGIDLSGISNWVSGTGITVIVGIVVAFLRRKGYMRSVQFWVKFGVSITKEIGEAFLSTSDVYKAMDNAIKEDGRLKENCVKDIIAQGKEAFVEWNDVIVIIKPKKKSVVVI